MENVRFLLMINLSGLTMSGDGNVWTGDDFRE